LGLCGNTNKKICSVDADNSSISAIPSVLEEVAKYGIASVKRVYGDWSSDTLKNWREVLYLMQSRQFSSLPTQKVKMLQI
jgi:hypothetical protein